MNDQERSMIDGLFQRLQQAEAQAGPRDQDAEALIAERMASQPGAAYMLAQVTLVQEQGLKNLTQRVEELERQLAERPQQSDGGFLGGLFGGGGARPSAPPRQAAAPPPAAKAPAAPSRGWSNQPPAGAAAMRPGQQSGGQAGAQQGGGGFMAGAMQTAVGVAGGMLVANAVAGMFADDAEAAPADAMAAPEPEAEPNMAPEESFEEPAPDEGGGFFDGLFGGDDEGF
jgi:hypothetical protein